MSRKNSILVWLRKLFNTIFKAKRNKPKSYNDYKAHEISDDGNFMHYISEGFRVYNCHLERGGYTSVLSKKPITKKIAQRILPSNPRNRYKYVTKNIKATTYDYISFDGNTVYRFYDWSVEKYTRIYFSMNGGEIDAWGIADIWESLTRADKHAIRSYIGDSRYEALTEGRVNTETAPSQFLGSTAAKAVANGNHLLARKLIVCAEEISDNPSVDLHHAYSNMATQYYKQRDSNPDAIGSAKLYYLSDVMLFPDIVARGYTYTKWDSFQRLAAIYEKEGSFQDAIDITELAISFGLDDGTKGGFEGRLARLQKKLQANSTNKIQE